MLRHASTSLASFMAAAEAGSFAAAAQTLGISAAAVGQNVKRLEDIYGVKLFNRTTRKMSLTTEGLLLFQRAREPLRQLDEIDGVFDESRGVVSGLLRITAPKYYATEVLIPLIAEFRAKHSKIEIDLDVSDLVRDLVANPIDIAVRIGALDDSTMIARRLSPLPIYTLASPAYLETRGTPSHPQDLMEHECLRYRFPTTGETWRWAYEEAGELKRYDPPGTLYFNDPEALVAATVQGMGLVQLDGLYTERYIKSGQLVRVLDDYTPTLFSLYLAYPSKDNMPLRTRTFVEFLLSAIPRNRYVLDG